MNEIDPYGEEIWGDENFPYPIIKPLETYRGIDPYLDLLINKINRVHCREQIWYNMPWWKKIFKKRIFFVYKEN